MTIAPLQGSQAPRIMHVPPAASSTWGEARELLELAGVHLDPWQQLVLENALGETAAGRWSAFEVVVNVARQNGKGEILLARQLVGMFLLEEKFQVHSAHQVDTSLEAFRRLLDVIENAPDLDQQVKRVSHVNGREGIELKSGCRIRFRSRSRGGGRGFTGDVLYLDEAMFLPEYAVGALLPALSGRSMIGDPQVWYAGSAVDQTIHADGIVFSRLRQRGLAGVDPALAYFEWSMDAAGPQQVSSDDAVSEDGWAAANPGLGIRISPDHIAKEQRSMEPRTFAVERLGVGDYHLPGGENSVISREAWAALADPTPGLLLDPVAFAFDVSPDRSSAAVCAAGARTDEHRHVEVVAHERGTGWVVQKVLDLVEKHEQVAVVCDASGPAGSLVPELEQAGVEVLVVSAREHAQACGLLFDAVEQQDLRHLGQAELAAAVSAGVKRPLGEAWAWSRRNSAADITPLVAATLALFGFSTAERETEIMVAFG